jgi:site-specific DNA-cytosine methylase
MLMLDLCSGLGGASAAMRARGWDVVTVDINPAFHPDVVADLREWSWSGPRPDLVWASPPCDEFAREFMPWCRTGRAPDLSLVLECKRIIDECRPRYWVIENVKGASTWLLPVLGKWRARHGAFFLWGYFPDLGVVDMRGHPGKAGLSSERKAERALIPVRLSESVARAVEINRVLL